VACRSRNFAYLSAGLTAGVLMPPRLGDFYLRWYA
jgi:hypothetical protein